MSIVVLSINQSITIIMINHHHHHHYYLLVLSISSCIACHFWNIFSFTLSNESLPTTNIWLIIKGSLSYLAISYSFLAFSFNILHHNWPKNNYKIEKKKKKNINSNYVNWYKKYNQLLCISFIVSLNITLYSQSIKQYYFSYHVCNLYNNESTLIISPSDKLRCS